MIVKWPFHRFSPFQRFHSGFLASRMDTGSSSCDGGSEMILFARNSPPNLSNWEKNRQCSNTQSERTDTQPTGDEYNERFFELRSAVVSIPTTTASSLYLAPYDGCQDTAWAHRNELQGIWGFNQTNSSENEACCHTKNCLNADKNSLFASLVWKAVFAPSHVQVLHSRFSKFNSQKEEQLSS